MNHKIILFCVPILFSMSACNKADLSEQILGTWEVVELQVDADSDVQIAKESYFVTFEENGTYSFRTDKNSCEGNYEVNDNGGFINNSSGCTYLPGDSEFSISIVKCFNLPKDEYNIRRRRLTIEGEGSIVLR